MSFSLAAVLVVGVAAVTYFLHLTGAYLDTLAGPDWGSVHLNRLDRLNRLFCQRFHRLEIDPAMQLPDQGGVVLVANHISGLDPMLLVAATPRPLRFVIAREQYERPWLNWLLRRIGCIPVDRSGRAERAFYQAKKAISDGEVVCVFPEGGIVSARRPVHRLKRGAIMLSELAEAPIVLVRISGVAGRGMNLRAIVRRSRARLTVGPLLRFTHGDRETRFSNMRRFIRPDLDHDNSALEAGAVSLNSDLS